MRAVVMAGGEGTRLRPLTTGTPKPLLPVVGRPIMEHVLLLLRQHGLAETVVTVQYLASLIRTYFGDGSELGVNLTYATEDRPLGTAGSIRNAERALRSDTFLVISGDALTDVDLTELVAVHRERGSLVTVGLTRRTDPVDFGLVALAEDGRVERFLEKPGWGQVFTDTVNAGIYVMEPEVLDHVPLDVASDWSHDVLPALIAAGAPVNGHVLGGYWEDVGTLQAYLAVQADVLGGLVQAQVQGFEVAPRVFVAEGAEVDPDAAVSGPAYIGPYAKVEAGVEVDEHAVIGTNVVVRSGARIARSVLHDNVFVGSGADLRGCVVGRSSDVMRGVRVHAGAVIGDHCTLGEEAIVSDGVRVYPGKAVDAGAVVNDSVIWESRGHGQLVGPRGVSGIVNVEITPETAVRLASAFATSLPKGATVTVARDHSRPARAFARTIAGALTAAAVEVRDLRTMPLPIARADTAQLAAGGILISTTPGSPESLDIVLLDERGADLGAAAAHRVERLLSRQELRRPFPGEIGDITTPRRVVDDYAADVLRCVDTSGIAEAGLKVVVDVAGGTASLVLPTLLARVGVDVLTVNGRLDESAPTPTEAARAVALERLGALVASSRAHFGIRIDATGERMSVVDDQGAVVDDERALLVLLDLVAAEQPGGLVALPVTTTRVAEQVTRFHHVDVRWTATTEADLARVVAAEPGLVFGGDGRGGYVVPAMGPHVDALAMFVRLLGLLARTRLPLSAVDARIPRAHVRRATVATPWARRGQAMRSVTEAGADRQIDLTDGVRVVEPDGSWALVLPDPAEAVIRLWAEAGDGPAAQDLLAGWVAIVERAGRS
ncbi:MAG: mannose-1-phosphate guanyltransferase [Actinomycetota bacterium]|nr:MAG: mannose-1-phosphate guanyltransferase [Actinomycetota bacterium]